MNPPSWATDFFPLDDQSRLILAFLIGALVFTVLEYRTTRQARQKKPQLPRYPRQPWHWPFRRAKIPWRLGPVTLDLRGGSQTRHAVVAGSSGTGKSSAVLSLLLGNMPALVVAFDNSRPIRDLFVAHGWTIWEPGGSLGWDFLKGSPQIVSECLTAGFAKTDQDTGYNRGLAQMRLWATMDALVERGRPRTLDVLVAALEQPGNNPDETRACRAWANRFSRIAKSLGPSLGTDLDLAECLARGEKVLMLPNRFLSPEDAPLIGAIAIVQARRVAQEVGNFLIIVEEAGQAGARQVEMNALAQAGRDRGCPLVVLTQNMAKLPEEVVNNVKIWISFAQESRRELTFAAEHLRIDPDDLLPERMPTGYAWIRSPDHTPRRVHIRLPKLPAPRSYAPGPTPLETTRPTARRTIVRELPRQEVLDYPSLPPPSLKVQEVLGQIDRSGHCHLWLGKLDRDGYGIIWMAGNWRRAHRVVYELAYGTIPLGPDGKPFELDHQCRVRRCVKLDHLEPVTKAENSRRRWRVRGI